jgi:DNA repair exonuclease SbcCD ATPase subunit
MARRHEDQGFPKLLKQEGETDMAKANGTNGQRARVLALHARNVKIIREVELNDLGDIVEIKGDAGQGKTSILDTIRAGLQGMDASMVRNGESSAEIVLDLDVAKVNRIIYRDGEKDLLTVTTPEGKRVEKAKEFLKTICGSTATFSPVDWVRLGGGEAKGKTERLRMQRDMLLNAVPVTLEAAEVATVVQDLGEEIAGTLAEVNLDGVDFEAHGLLVCDALEKACYERRKRENEKAEDAENALKLTPAPEKAAPGETLDECMTAQNNAAQRFHKLAGQLEAARDINERRASLKARLDAEERDLPHKAKVIEMLASRDHDRAVAECDIDRLKRELASAQERLASINEDITTLTAAQAKIEAFEAKRAELASMTAPEGVTQEQVDQARAELERAQELTARRKAQDAHDAAAHKATEAREKAARLDALVKLFRDEMPKLLIERMAMPVEGLGVQDGVITINGVPLHQLGTSQQIRIGVQVAAALNPHAGFVCVDGAESMGKADRLALRDEAGKLGIQLIMTFVDPEAAPGNGAIVMREGAVAQA